ncbi:MAG TPA: hypothetical protein DIC60_03745 [Lachnospiraceae bacterium]|nr:hypothetical protein [Lachnospiraceae bacterium]
MYILFLDVDGPLKTIENYHPSTQMGFYKFNEECVYYLNKILEVPWTKIVVSSDWKAHLDYLRALFEKNGIDGRHIIDSTPRLKDKNRGDEIQAWRDTMGKFFDRKGGKYKIEKILIIDDNRDMGDLLPYLIQTYFADGITKEIADAAIEYLTLDKPITVRYITPEEQRKRNAEWENELEKGKPSLDNKDSFGLMKVPQHMSERGKFTTICYYERFQWVEVETRPKASITRRTVL